MHENYSARPIWAVLRCTHIGDCYVVLVSYGGAEFEVATYFQDELGAAWTFSCPPSNQAALTYEARVETMRERLRHAA